MKLGDYLRTSEISDVDFAGLVGRDRSSVTKWRLGKMRPDWEALGKIREVTDGAVTPTDFLDAAADISAEAAE